jgi:hypothetical protein
VVVPAAAIMGFGLQVHKRQRTPGPACPQRQLLLAKVISMEDLQVMNIAFLLQITR